MKTSGFDNTEELRLWSLPATLCDVITKHTTTEINKEFNEHCSVQVAKMMSTQHTTTEINKEFNEHCSVQVAKSNTDTVNLTPCCTS